MDKTGFYIGVALIIFGSIVWIFRPNITGQGGKFKLPGIDITIDGPAFVLITLGIILMYLSQGFKPDLIPPPPPAPRVDSFRVCRGEKAGKCGSHTHYYSCVDQRSDDQVAKDICQGRPYKTVRVQTFGGNKCGYGVNDVTCN